MSSYEESGTFRAYGPKLNLRGSTLELIDKTNTVLEQAHRDNVKMTLRNVHYKFVKNGWYANTDESYNRLKNAVGQGRLAGLISWTDIEDNERDLMGVRTYEAPEQMLRGLAGKFSMDLWAGQPWRPEVWVEKKGMTNVIADICTQLRVDFFASKGYNSLTEAWKAGQRLRDYIQRGQRPIIFYAGDHDPSGLDMVRNNIEQLELFAGTPIMVVHIALTWDQVQALGPDLPPNPAKQRDARLPQYIEYMERKGADDPEVSWEVDALEPTYIRQLIDENVSRIRDERLWDQALLEEQEGKRYLAELAGEA